MEQIYTIPVNEAFDEVIAKSEVGCPFCVMYRRLQNNELDTILGASMMEPNIRMKTNELGFCHNHYSMMKRRSRNLSLALVLESHLDEVIKRVDGRTIIGKTAKCAASGLSELESSCYVCGRVDGFLSAMIANTVYLFETDEEFRKKMEKAPYFCLPHYRAMLDYSMAKLSKKNFRELYKLVYGIERSYVASLKNDISTFCRSFDYRYSDVPVDSKVKASIPRTEKFLSGEMGWEE